MNLSKQKGFDIVSLYFIPEFHLSRIYVKKKVASVEDIDEDFSIYIYNNQKVYKIALSDFIKEETDERDILVDICVLTRNP